MVQMTCADSTFTWVMTASGILAKVTKHGRIRQKCGYNIGLVFMDTPQDGVLPPLYWVVWKCPHLFYCLPGQWGSPPEGWVVHSEVLPYSHVGGSTNAIWALVLWVLRGVDIGAVLPVPQ